MAEVVEWAVAAVVEWVVVAVAVWGAAVVVGSAEAAAWAAVCDGPRKGAGRSMTKAKFSREFNSSSVCHARLVGKRRLKNV